MMAGCEKKVEVDKDDPKNSHIAVLSSEYAKYQYFKRGAAPKNEGELVQFLSEQSLPQLKKLGLSDAKELLTSNRDNEPLVINYGKPGRTPEGDQVLAYEKTGKGGKRLVALNGGGFEEMDEARFKKVKLP
jgi:hypothetical protein